MRIQLSYANAYLVRELIAANAVADVGDNGMDLIELDLHGGEPVTVHLMERDIDVDYIADMLGDDSRRKRASMFILWSSMLLPDDGMLYQPYDWMMALLALYGDKIYGFDVYATNVSMFPVYFTREPDTALYHIRYGDPIEMNRIGAETIHAQSYVRGTWRIVDFEEGRRIRPASSSGKKRENANNDEASRFDHIRGDRNPMWVYYDLLGVTAKDNADAVRRAYRILAMKYHPDLNTSPEATEHMQQINMAYTQIMKLLGED
jgi:hypothetical protein